MIEHSTDPTSADARTNPVGAAQAAVIPSAAPAPSSAASTDFTAITTGGSAIPEVPMSLPKEGLGPDAAKADAASIDISRMDVPKMDAPKIGAAGIDHPKTESADSGATRPQGKIMVMSPSRDHTWSSESAGAESAPAGGRPGLFGKRRAAALAAVIAVAALAGAVGGALATAGLTKFSAEPVKVAGNPALEDTVSRVQTEVAALRTSLEHTSKLSVSQFNKVSERLDKIEKAQAEPAAKLAKISEAVERLRAAPAIAAAPAASRENTASIGSVTAPALASTPVPAPRPETSRLPTVDGWVLRDVADGGALIEGRRGAYEVFAGDTIPGLGRVDAIRRQDGRWVVVTSKGLVVAR